MGEQPLALTWSYAKELGADLHRVSFLHKKLLQRTGTRRIHRHTGLLKEKASVKK